MWCTFRTQKRDIQNDLVLYYMQEPISSNEGKRKGNRGGCARTDKQRRWRQRRPKIAETKKLKLYKFQIHDKRKRKTLSEKSHWNDLKKTEIWREKKTTASLDWINGFQGFGKCSMKEPRKKKRTTSTWTNEEMHLSDKYNQTSYLFSALTFLLLLEQQFHPGFNNYYARWDFYEWQRQWQQRTTKTTRRKLFHVLLELHKFCIFVVLPFNTFWINVFDDDDFREWFLYYILV